MENYDAKDLISKYVKGETSLEENNLVEQGFLNDLREGGHSPSQERIELAGRRIRTKLVAHISRPQPKKRLVKLWPRVAIAASVIFVLFVAIFFIIHKPDRRQQIAKRVIHDVAPGSAKAYLTLANGKTVLLANAVNGFVVKQGNISVKRTKDELVYQSAEESTGLNGKVAYNSVTVPQGAEYQVLVLPDGTKVWINSASSLRYPTSFTGNDRKVELKGEAYFEVAHNAAKPFRVVSNHQIVEILGTHFNINAYDDEPSVTTTLLEGKVKITAIGSTNTQFLLPGQQAALTNQLFAIKDIDTEQAIAWKNGRFAFEGENIQYIMRTIARWYNVEIEYKGEIPTDTFGGGTSRFANVSTVLNILELTGKVHFKIEGQKIIVSK